MAVIVCETYYRDEDGYFIEAGKRTINTKNIDHIYQDEYNSDYYWVLFYSGNETAIRYWDFDKVAEAMNY